MNRRVFHSSHHGRDAWRVSVVRSMGVVEGQRLLEPNLWQKVEHQSQLAIKRWIDAQMTGKSCVVVLIGAETATRYWVKYEIRKAWQANKGVVGIHIHRSNNPDGTQDARGRNPLDDISVGHPRLRLSLLAKTYEPPTVTSRATYAYIKSHLETWVEEAIAIRRAHNARLRRARPLSASRRNSLLIRPPRP